MLLGAYLPDLSASRHFFDDSAKLSVNSLIPYSPILLLIFSFRCSDRLQTT